jgi:hypothetical protein
MNNLKYRLLNNWHFMRLLRLGISLFFLASAFDTKDWLIGMFGAFFLYQAVTDTGCCASNGCKTPSPKPLTKSESITFEEIK